MHAYMHTYIHAYMLGQRPASVGVRSLQQMDMDPSQALEAQRKADQTGGARNSGADTGGGSLWGRGVFLAHLKPFERSRIPNHIIIERGNQRARDVH